MALQQHKTAAQIPASSTTRKSKSPRPRSPAQLAASRANAKHSTGPRTKAGKERSRGNSWKHGFYSDEFTAYLKYAYHEIGDLDFLEEDLRETRTNLRRQYRPCAPEEATIVDRLALLWHRLYRLDCLSHRGVRWMKEEKRDLVDSVLQDEALAPKEARLERSISRLRKDLAFLQRMRLGRDPQWGVQDLDPDAEASLAEFETQEAEEEQKAAEPESDEESNERASPDAQGETGSGEVPLTTEENNAKESNGYDENSGTNPSSEAAD